jgi:hypothetical protein
MFYHAQATQEHFYLQKVRSKVAALGKVYLFHSYSFGLEMDNHFGDSFLFYLNR